MNERSGQWRCQVCGYMDRNEDDLTDHMLEEHTEWVETR